MDTRNFSMLAHNSAFHKLGNACPLAIETLCYALQAGGLARAPTYIPTVSGLPPVGCLLPRLLGFKSAMEFTTVDP